MGKRKSWLYSIFAVLVIISLVMLLIFWPKKGDDNPDDAGQDEIVEEQPEEEGNDGTAETIPEEIYATSFVVNLPSTINILNGTTINLISGYVQVQPSEMADKIEMEIVPRYSSSAFGLELNNFTITAKEVGTYNLILSVSKSKTTSFNETILITVYEEESNSHISQTANSIIKGEKINISDIFSIKGDATFDVITDSKATIIDNCITATTTGTSKIIFKFTENYVQYVYEFEIIVKDQPQYYFVLNNVTNNAIELNLESSPVFHVNYKIQNREEGDISQDIVYVIGDETIVEVEDITNPLIKIRALKVGETTLTLTCKVDNSVKVEITIIVK